ncbi:MAG: hypothetical protein ABW123_28910 [Cystobacter sp.]
MTVPHSSLPASSESSTPEKPRLVINGVPVRPEDLGRSLSEAVRRRLNVAPERFDGAPLALEEPSAPGRAPWLLGVLAVAVALGLAVWLWVK